MNGNWLTTHQVAPDPQIEKHCNNLQSCKLLTSNPTLTNSVIQEEHETTFLQHRPFVHQEILV